MDAVSKFCPICGAQQDIQKVNDETPATVGEKTTEADFLSKLGLLSSSNQPKKPSIIPGFGQGANYKKSTSDSSAKKTQTTNTSKTEKNTQSQNQQNASSAFFNDIFNNSSNKEKSKVSKNDSVKTQEQKPVITEEYPKNKNNDDFIPVSVVDIGTNDIPVFHDNTEGKAQKAADIQFVDDQNKIDDSFDGIPVIDVQSVDNVDDKKQLPEQEIPIQDSNDLFVEQISVPDDSVPFEFVEDTGPALAQGNQNEGTGFVEDLGPAIVQDNQNKNTDFIENIPVDNVPIVDIPIVDVPIIDVPVIDTVPVVDNQSDGIESIPVVNDVPEQQIAQDIPVIDPVSTTDSKNYSVPELVELGEKNNKIELAEPPKKMSRAEMFKKGKIGKTNNLPTENQVSAEKKDSQPDSNISTRNNRKNDIQSKDAASKKKGLFGKRNAVVQGDSKEEVVKKPSRRDLLRTNKTSDLPDNEQTKEKVSNRNLIDNTKTPEKQQPLKQNTNSSAVVKPQTTTQTTQKQGNNAQPKRKPTAERAKLLDKEIKKDIGEFFNKPTDSFSNLPKELPDEAADNARQEESLRKERQRKTVAEGRKSVTIDRSSRKRNFVTEKDVEARKVEDIYHVDAEEEGYDNYYENVLTVDHDFKQKRKIPFKEIGIILVALTALVIFAYFFLINNFDFD